MDRVGVAAEAEDLRTEGVQTISADGQRAQELFNLAGLLAAADAADTDQRERGEVDAVALV